jgi:hypothetical protein
LSRWISRDAAAALWGSWVTITIVLPKVLVELLQQREHVAGAVGVEVTGRLVGEDDVGIGHDRTSDGDALLLAAGELAGEVIEAILQADELQRGRARLATASFAQRCELQR